MRKIVFSVLLIGCLLLTGCTVAPKDTQPSEPTKATQPPTTAATTQATEPAPTTEPTPTTEETLPGDDLAGDSLVSFRQAMVGTPQLFAAAYFGKTEPESDIFALMQEAAPQLCNDLPFLPAIPQENIVGTYGYLFCIVPADETATVAVNRRWWNGETFEEPEVLYRSEMGEPILVLCPDDNRVPDTEVIITDSNGNVAVWYPYMDSDFRVAALCNDAEESLIFDFTSYGELPDPFWNQGELIGTWELAWTEVEGDRNEVASGVCTVKITMDDMGSFRITYQDRDFPDWNFTDRELLLILGELYPGCGNDQWLGEVSEEPGDTSQYALTLLEDGTLLLQTYWEMDGMPMVSYGWYRRIA